MKMNENDIAKIIVDTAVNLHKRIGPGLLESVYEAILSKLLIDKGLKVERQVKIPIVFDHFYFDEGFRADIIVENKVIIELKSVERLNHVYSKQLLTYLRLSGKKVGLLLNFGAPYMKEGIERIVNGLEE
jgi:GxxExxY protein